MRAVVIGGAGFLGGELLRLLHAHPEVTEVVAVSRSAAGRRLSDVHPALDGIDGAFSGRAPEDAARSADVVFLALEHGAAQQLVPTILAERPGIVCDLSADFRVRDAVRHAAHYGARKPAAQDAAEQFVYALADLAGKWLRGRRALAVPGCFATAAQLALAPLADLPRATTPVLFAITGSSGAGASPGPTTHHPLRAHNVFAYAPLSHRHDAEIAERWRSWTGEDDAPRLAVHAGPFVRGIYLTARARLAEPADAADRYRRAYAAHRFVRVLDAPPQLTRVIGSNRAELSVAVNGDELQVTIAIDNLIKGGAGQAVQAVNLSLGLDEAAGLATGGVFPC